MIDDPNFIDVIVQELKSQGLFDQFRKECLADVDTKPAYQNLRQRVDGTVNKFLAQQEWSDNIRYKNQLRDQLRKNIIDSGFLDTGVERIVDQVVNPKISTVFQPKVEEIVYNYLGIEKPKSSSVNGNESKPELLLEDLEAVSPDSDKKSEASVTSPLPPQPTENTEEDMEIDEELDESKEQDDFESPAFEPLEVRSPSKTKEEINDSNSSAISGLTSQESVESDDKEEEPPAEKPPTDSSNAPPVEELENPTTKDSDFSQEIAPNNDSQLSQVSSNSQLLTTTTTVPSTEEEPQPPQENERLDITEEAQMPTLFTNSADKPSEPTEGEGDDAEDGAKKKTFNFDKDEYDFVGTGRSTVIVRDHESSPVNLNIHKENDEEDTPTKTSTETPTEAPTKDAQVPSFSTQEDTTSQSEHSLKICEDTFSDDDTKEESQSADVHHDAVPRSPIKEKELSDASSFSFKSEPESKSKPASPKEPSNGLAPRKSIECEQINEEQDEAKEEGNKKIEEPEDPKKTPNSNAEDDHYEEHLKQQVKRRASDRDSDDSNDKSAPSGPPPPSGESKPTEETAVSTQEPPDNSTEQDKPTNSGAADSMESSEGLRNFGRTQGSVTPSRVDSSSSGIQSGDDSEKSPESLKTYAKSESIVLPVQPVVIDQMLTIVEDSQLERLLNGDTPTNDATLESLQRKWQSADGRVRKPKFASNFSEARRLMKVRKQMQREEQKCREQALAMAKKYITENKVIGAQMAEDQGIELEFVCDGKRKSPGPLISSPVPKAEPVQPNESDPDLLYFPEEGEVFPVNEAHLNFLRTQTNGLTFGRNFKLEHYRSEICTLSPEVAQPAKKATKRSASKKVAGPKAKRTSSTINGVAKELDVGADNQRVASLALRRQRSIRTNASHQLQEKNTPPSVGTDA
ncbi:biorientation of chromosomes in cell division protein 1-like 1 [Anopheles ziemanni]|uniref:biorientation of chromosomes in cell division protein 1-like 1 n=1 Tax=Anopheles coustani TaxID=139045 RepID=UPI00265A0FF4|nr:biorientation of chromosomes in cell division protein 1-like 1 [Anopheles coustani]XP_058171332.1 biorientation of chromosomes in cell division protein 1-like 1 [Anopheles ziemanni]